MTIAEYSVTAFAVLNGARVIAYVPQIRCLTRDNSNAAAVSLVTWTLFSLANAATVAYALLVINDPLMAGIFLSNLLGCLIIVVIIARKRFFQLPRVTIARRNSVDHRMLGRLLRAWQRSKQKRLELHLRLTVFGGQLKRHGTLFPVFPANDRCRHPPAFASEGVMAAHINRSPDDPAPYNHRGTVVVAGAWLAFYIAAAIHPFIGAGNASGVRADRSVVAMNRSADRIASHQHQHQHQDVYP